MEDLNKDVKPGEDPTPPKDPAGKKEPAGSEPVKTPEETIDELLNQDKRILVDKDRFNDRNDKAKLYETFAPLIDKIKDKPDLVAELLETKEKGSLESRFNQMEQEMKETKRRELREAVSDALNRWPGFDKDWSEIREDVDKWTKKGLNVKDAISRVYIAFRPELAVKEAERIAKENFNASGAFIPSRGGRSPQVIPDKDKVVLNDMQKKVFQDLVGKDFGGGFIPIKSEEDYVRLMEKHRAHMTALNYYQLP